MTNYRLLTILLGSLLLSACTQFAPYRTAIPDQKSAEFYPFECVVDAKVDNHPLLPLCEKSATADSQTLRPDWPPNCTTDEKSVTKDRRRCEDPGSQAIQHRFYRTSDGQEGDYYLSFVEFDDQGWFADREQMKALFALLKDIEKKNKETNGHTLIQVYAHGWKHNANACDNNVRCFSRLLERTDLAEKNKEFTSFMLNQISKEKKKNPELLEKMSPSERDIYDLVLYAKVGDDLMKMSAEKGTSELDKIKPRTVVGVYLGWRGLPFDTPLNNLSFWSRKDTAARVGSGGVLELLTRLKDYRDIRQSDGSADADMERADTNKTQLVITGHSFGGLVIYSALSHALIERATKTWRARKTIDFPDPPAEYGMAKSFGDFVLLVNPAFEGSLYEPFFNVATNRCYKETQRPVMMIVTSKADKATGIAFPIGRTLDTLFQHRGSSEQRDSMNKTIGHNERYKTHDLILEGEPNRLDDKYVEKGDCDCPQLRPTSELTLEEMQGDSFEAMWYQNYGKGLSLKPVSSPRYASNYPYLVVTTEANIIADHNAIYNGNFTLFAQQFFQKHITLQQPLPLPTDPKKCWLEESSAGSLMPPERSCDNKGQSCSGQKPMN